MKKDPALLRLQCRRAYEALPHQHRRFVDEYIITLGASESAIAAGIKKSSAHVTASRWLSTPNIALAIMHAMNEKSALARIDSAWVLKRLAMLADFNIKRFIIVDEGRPYYDFAAATDEDWYCIDEITIDALRGRVREGGRIYVDSVKLKSTKKLDALKAVGQHTNVQAFKERADGEGSRKITEVKHSIVRPGELPPPVKKVTGPASPGSLAVEQGAPAVRVDNG